MQKISYILLILCCCLAVANTRNVLAQVNEDLYIYCGFQEIDGCSSLDSNSGTEAGKGIGFSVWRASQLIYKQFESKLQPLQMIINDDDDVACQGV